MQNILGKIKARYLDYIENFYKTKYDKNVLISYITHPFFLNSTNYSHSNNIEVLEIAKIFNLFKYNVYIVNYNSPKNINYGEFDVIFGFGEPFENSFYYENNKSIRIYYATGAHVNYQNNAELQRLLYLKERKGKLLKPRRLVKKTWSCSTTLCDAIISLGNKFTVDTYRLDFKTPPIYNIPVSCFAFYKENELCRDLDIARKNFLWFGSSGLVHKGLDLCLDVFAKLPDLNLHICGPKEDDFFQLYNNELFELNNITYHGFVDISSEVFKIIAERCAFVIFPSCSEGGGGALLTCMATGLIPIATVQSSVNFSKSGFTINEATVLEINNLIRTVCQLGVKELKEKSQAASALALNEHNIQVYKYKLKEALTEINI